MGGGALGPPVTAAGGGDTYARSTPFAANFHSHQSCPVIHKALYLPCSSQSTALAEACSENLASSDVDDNLDRTSFEGRQTIEPRKSYFDLGPAPALMEAEKALADLQRFIQSKTKSDMSNSTESNASAGESRALQSAGYGRGGLPDALNMLQKDPSMQSTVISISCDKAVWDAILSSAAVQDLRGSLSASSAKEGKIQISIEKFDAVDFILKHLTEIAKSKVVELIEKLGALVAEIFKPANEAKPASKKGNNAKPASELNDLVEEKIRSLLHVAIVVLWIVIVARNF